MKFIKFYMVQTQFLRGLFISEISDRHKDRARIEMRIIRIAMKIASAETVYFVPVSLRAEQE
jgi:hypothetical protein